MKIAIMLFAVIAFTACNNAPATEENAPVATEETVEATEAPEAVEATETPETVEATETPEATEATEATEAPKADVE